MDSANGKPLTESEALALIRSWLPLLSDRARGMLRAELCRPMLIRHENLTRPEKEEQAK